MGTGHIHDFNPGISPNGVFWTDHVPRSSVQFDLGAVTASLRVTNFAIPDTIPVPTVGAIVTMDIEWSGLTAEVKVKDLVNGFAGSYRECHATINWTATRSPDMPRSVASAMVSFSAGRAPTDKRVE